MTHLMTALMTPLIAQVKQLRAQIEIAAANAAAMAHAHRLHTADKASLRALLPPAHDGAHRGAHDGASCASSTSVGAQGGAPSSPVPKYGTPLLPASPSMHAAGASSWAAVTPSGCASSWAAVTPSGCAAAPSAVPATTPLVPATTPQMRAPQWGDGGSAVPGTYDAASFVSRELIEANLRALEIADEAREHASKLHEAEAALETARAEAAAARAALEVERRERSDWQVTDCV